MTEIDFDDVEALLAQEGVPSDWEPSVTEDQPDPRDVTDLNENPDE